MTILPVDLPDDIIALPDQTVGSLAALAREALVVRLYAQQEVSAGWASSVLGITRQAFHTLLHAYHIPIRDHAADLEFERERITRQLQPRTPLMEHLVAARAQIIAAGEPLLDWEGVEQERASRRGNMDEA